MVVHLTFMPCDWTEKTNATVKKAAAAAAAEKELWNLSSQMTASPDTFKPNAMVWICQRTLFKMFLRVTIKYCYSRNSPLSGLFWSPQNVCCSICNACVCACDSDVYVFSLALLKTFYFVYLCITMFVFILNKLSNVCTQWHTQEIAAIEARTTLNPCQTQPNSRSKSSSSSSNNSGGKRSHIHHI